MQFFISEQLKARLARIDSPISKALLELKEVDETNKNVVNYLSISEDNCALISYMDKGKIDRYKDIKTEVKEIDWDKPFIVKMDGRVKPSTFDKDFKSKAYKPYLDNWDGKFYKSFTPATYQEYKDWIISEPTYCQVGVYLNGHHTFGTRLYAIELYHRIINYIKGFEPQYKIIINEAIWDSKLRIKAASAKTIRRILGDSFSSDEYEKFATLFKSEAMRECGTNSKFLYEEAKAERIKWAYDEENYISNCGELGSSCMRYKSCQKFFNIYIKNPDKCSLAVFTVLEADKEKVAARALIWRGVNDQADTIFFDRIYAYDNDTFLQMKVHLEDLGYLDLYKKKQYNTFSINLENWDHSLYPYIDSFKYADNERFSTNEDYGERTYSDTDGKWREYESEDEEDDDLYVCNRCASRVDSLNTVVAGDYRNQELCNDCVVHSSYHRGYISTSDAQDTRNGDWIVEDEVITTEEGCYHLPTEEGVMWVTIGDEYHDLDEDRMVQVDGQWVWIESLVEEEQ